MASFASNCLVDTLATKVNTKCLNPSSQNTFQSSDIVSVMDDELSQGILPLLKATSQEYFVYNVDVPIVQGTSAYTFPTRAIGNALRDVVLVDSAGNEVSLNNLMREYIKVSFPFTFVPTIWTFGQYPTANEINLYNTMIQTYTSYKLRFITERRPGGLTLSTNCGQITAIAGNVVTLSAVDPTWMTSTTFDIINQLPPFQSRGDDQTITLIAGSQLTFSSLPSTVQKGDWVCPAMLSCIPQIPYDMFPLLVERTVATLAEALDMSQLLAASKAKIQEFEERALKLARPRVKGSPRIILNKDSLPHLGFGGFGGGFWR
ncbi:MAG: hypothetical protein KGL39_20065 [Patescibacteria group bacterium]|nr:hypothetical protein [Patescibacteria group bacterium]